MKKSGSFSIGAVGSTFHDLISAVTGIFFCALLTRSAGKEALFVFALVSVHLRFVRMISMSGPAFGADGETARLIQKKDWKSVLFLQRYAIAIQAIFSAALAVLVFALLKFVPGLIAANLDEDILTMLSGASWKAAAVCLLIGADAVYSGILEGMNRNRTCLIAGLINAAVRLAGFLAAVYLYSKSEGAAWVSGWLYSIAAGFAASAFYQRIAIDRANVPIASHGQNQARPAMARKKIRSEFWGWFSSSAGMMAVFGLSAVCVGWIWMAVSEETEALAFLLGSTALLSYLPSFALYAIGADGFESLALSSRRRGEDALRSPFMLVIGRYLYIAVPAGFAVCVLAPQIMHILFDLRNPVLEQIVFLQGIDGPVLGLVLLLTKMMIVLQFGGFCVFYLAVGLIAKAGLLFFLIPKMGVMGVFVSGWISALAVIFLCLAKIHNRFEFNGLRSFLHLLKIFVSCMCMNGVFAAAEMAGFGGLADSAVMSLLQFAAILAGGCGIYYLISRIMQVPQALYSSVRRKDSEI